MRIPDSGRIDDEAAIPMIDGVPLHQHLTEEQLEGMYQRAQRALEALARKSIERVAEPDWHDAASFYVSLAMETDRAIPVLAFAFIDTEFERALRNVFNPDVVGGVAQLFGPLGPVGSASARINMAHALFWVGDELARDLHILRRIRNRFAHKRMPSGLDDQTTVDLLAKHRGLPATLGALFGQSGLAVDWNAPLPEIVATEPPLHFNTRNKLIFASAVTAWQAMAHLYVVPPSQRSGVHPAALLSPASPEAPSGIRAQHEAFKSFIDGLIGVLLTSGRVDRPPS